jgi:predicted nucleic acid-binding protein
MINKILIDSSILIEYIKKKKTKLLLEIISNLESEGCINEVIVSEFLYHLLIINGNASPRSLQSSKKIQQILSSSSEQKLLKRFTFLSTDESIVSLAPSLMAQYNLLPNDAIILATCKIHGITQLASHDKDFVEPCKAEGITLLTE